MKKIPHAVFSVTGYVAAIAATIAGFITSTDLVIMVSAWCGGWFARQIRTELGRRRAVRKAARDLH